jgi:hypothetical protein
MTHTHEHSTRNENRLHNEHPPYWKRMHHDWRFWFAVVLMLAAMAMYVLSDNELLGPRGRPQQFSVPVGQ